MKLFLSIILVSAVIIYAGDKKYGSKITLKEKTDVSAILENPSEYLDKKVLIEGKVVDVCSHMGCWMEIAGDKEGEIIKVKVKDGEIVFPVEAKGKTALVEGTVYSIEMDEEEAREYFAHMAEDAGKEFDPESVKGPVTVYQVKGLGAVIKD